MSLDDTEIIAAATNGDSDAMRDLLERHGPQVCSAISKRIDPQWRALVDPDDVMQVTYMEAFLDSDRITARDGQGFVAWLRRIAENNLRDAIKELQRKKRPPPARRIGMQDREESYVALVEQLGMTTTTPSRHAAQQEISRIIEAVLDRLPPDYAAAIRLYDLQGKSISDVASEMGRSTGAVHMLRSRAHDRLRRLLGRETAFFTHTA